MKIRSPMLSSLYLIFLGFSIFTPPLVSFILVLMSFGICITLFKREIIKHIMYHKTSKHIDFSEILKK